MRRKPSEVVDWRIQWQKGTSNDLQNTGQKTKDRATHSPLKASAPERLAVSTSLMTLVVLLLNDTNIIWQGHPRIWTPECDK